MTTVLVVDDSASIRAMVSDELKQGGLNVLQAADGVEAIEKIQVHAPDLVITDIVMPKMNGYELCRWIKSDPKAKTTPVVMCSSKSEEFDRYWGTKQGADAYITKPYHPTEMVTTVKRLLKQ